MNNQDFYQGLKEDNRNDDEFAAGAEHFVRLKQQTGLDQHQFNQELEKLGFEIQPSDRSDIPKKYFAQPNKEEVGHKGKYPIPDRQHARSALGFAKMHHDSKALAAVEDKIKQKYPDMLHDKEKDAGICSNCGVKKEACACSNKMASMDPLMIAAPAIGAGILGGLTYLRSRPHKETGKSRDETEAEELLRSTQPDTDSGYLEKLRHNFSTSSRDLARTAREHPVKAALTGAGAGALAGNTIAKLLGAGGKA